MIVTSSKIQDGACWSGHTRVVAVILDVDHRNLYTCTKVLAQTCGTEFLFPAQYACAVHYACAEENFKEKRS